MSEEARRLKDEGNTFFQERQYLKAYYSYSDAILLDNNNAVLYANRAACRLAMNQYLDALEDGRRATEIDPSYPKAWFRCASAMDALEQYTQSVHMYEKTLEALAKLPMTSADTKLRKHCETLLEAARKAAAQPLQISRNAIQADRRAGLMPWEVAEKIFPEISGDNFTASSAWSIYCAHKDFTQGIVKLKEMKEINVGGGRAINVRMGVLSDITNALLRDTRVFHIEDGDLLIKMKDQVQCERNHWNAWPIEIGPETLQEKAMERLRKEGWDSTRPALSLIVRHWIYIGFIAQKVASNHSFAMEAHKNALNVINWGRQVWKDVPSNERGTIFDLSFRRGVWSMYIDTLMAALSADKENMELIENIFEEADAILKDIKQNPYNSKDFNYLPDFGFYLSFYCNIEGSALACKGLCHHFLAEFGSDRSPKTIISHYQSAIEMYTKAAGALPEDDELHTWYLYCAYNFMEVTNTPASIVMKTLERIRLSLPKMRRIWCQNLSVLSKEKEDTYARVLKIEERAKSHISQGSMTLNEPFPWDAVKMN